jgi:hypothetical protein
MARRMLSSDYTETRRMRKFATTALLGHKWVIALAVVLTDAAITCAPAQIAFQDVSVAAGFGNSATETWGASWGDLDGDHYPDLFSSNHRQAATLYHNNQDGTFTDVSKQVDLSKTPGWTNGYTAADTHGATWADLNNDGQEDLIEAVSSSADHVWINNGGKLTLSTTALGVDKIRTRAKRQILAFDFNGDGRLDLASIGLTNPSWSPQLANGTFGTGGGFSQPMACTTDGQWGRLADVNSSPGFEVICAPRTLSYPKVNAFASGVISDISAQYQQFNNINDSAELDYDGDLLPDFFLVRAPERPSDAYQYSPQGLEAQFITGANAHKYITFQSTGLLTVTVSMRAGQVSNEPPNNGNPAYIHIGSSPWSPTSLTFQLDPTDANNAGITLNTMGVSIGYLSGTAQWEISQGSSQYTNSYVQVTSTAPITGLAFFGASGPDLGLSPYVLHNTPNGFVPVKHIGLDSPERCESVVSGDFDNDMHEDIFVACTGGSHNLPNRLFRNNGNGTFTEVPNAGGAAGLVGAAIADGAGTSDSVVTADYDLDGFLDLLVTNGLNMYPVFTGGPKQLFHNVGNSNSWMEFDLVGTTSNGTSSNRDGIGSKVYVTTPLNSAGQPGPVTQYREQNGGYHRWSQNFMRVHVGLATNTQADVTVVWPDGTSTTYLALPARHVYQLKEDGTSLPIH